MNKYFFFTVIIFAFAYNVTVYAQGQPLTKKRADSASIAGMWYLLPVLPSDTATGKIPTLSFNLKKSQFSGNDGCNDISGTFALADDKLSFSDNIKGTRIECKGYDEKTFLHNLLLTSNYKIEDSILMLMNGKTVLSTWSKTNSKNKAQKKSI